MNEKDEIWICEGIFDMISLRQFGYKSVSPSSAMWSGIQLYQLIEKKPGIVNIFCDNDRVGLKTGLVLSKFFNLVGIPSKTIHSKYCKDASEHLLEKKLPLEDFEEIKIDRKMVEDKDDNSFDFLKYLQKRKF
jgi:5S rRNA maturation endonuclease (ribonuclease M5)